MSDPEVSTAKLLLVEYERLKEEQKVRIGFRDNLIYATLASMAGVIAATLSGSGNVDLLLLLPPIAFVLGWTYLANDQKVSAIGRYIRCQLQPRLAAVTNTTDEIFGWEADHRSDSSRLIRKSSQLAVDLTMFGASGAAALIIYWLEAAIAPMLLALSIIELVVIVLLAVQIVLAADLKARCDHSGR
ncbi:hypothetical protein AB0C50_13120 [Micromonospora taraxaci]|uniref:hypothetical protein n=1 Tax=Micromonospora taraxaci TaxID=1316803 RepID=UPI0033F0AA61